MGIKFSNLASTTLASTITSSATSITVADGSVFPALGSGDFFFASIDSPPNASEIVKVTAISGNSLTVVRGQDGTTATTHSSGEVFALRVVAAVLEDLRDNTDTTYTAGTNLSLSGTTFNLNTNLSGLGTISSGAITSSGRGTFDELTLTGGTDNLTFNEASGDWTINNAAQNNGITIYDGTKGVEVNYNGAAVAEFDGSGGMNLISGSLRVGGTAVIDSSRNLTNVGTISSGAITSSGTVTWSGGSSTNANTAYGWGNHASAGYLTSLSFNNLTGKTSGTGDYSTSGNLAAGRGSGSIALTVNDGKGNSNLTFNHENGVPDQSGNAARIEVNTDSSSSATMFFEVKSNVTGGTSVDLTPIVAINESGLTLEPNMALKVGSTTVIDSSRNLTNIGTISASGQVTADRFLSGIGSVASPAYKVGDADSGFYDSGANMIGVALGGVLEYDFQPTKLDMKGNQLDNVGDLQVDVTSSNGVRVTGTDSVADAAFTTMLIDHNASGSDTTTADRSHIGLAIDMDSSATGGNTANEHRLFGIHSHVKSTGDSDLIHGIYASAEAEQTAGQVSALYGGYFQALGDVTGGTLTNSYGVYGYNSVASASGTTITNNYALYGKTLVGATQDSNVNQAVGVYGEVEIDVSGASTTLSSAHVFQAQFDNDSAGDVTINTGYLYYGNYAGTLPSTAYGVYIADAVRNYFGGSLTAGLGSTTTASYGFNGDLNTGMYSPANHEVALLANGTNRLNINASGAQVTGSVTASGALQIGGTTVIDSSREGSFATRAQFGGIDSAGNVAPPSNNTIVSGYGLIGNRGTMYITNGGGAIQLGNGGLHNGDPGFTISTSNANLGSGRSLSMNGTTVIDSSRNLSNIGTISSGAITSSGAVKAYGNSDTVSALEIYSDSNHGMRILHRGTDGDFSFERRVSGTNTEFLRIGRGTGNATFAGTISSGAITITDGTTNGASTIGGSSDQLLLDTNADTGVTIRSGASSTGVVSFASPTDHNVGQVYYDHNADSMVLRTNDAAALTIDSSQNATFAGDITVSTGDLSVSGLVTADRFYSGLGTAASPAFQVGDTNTGFFDSGSNTIGVACSGAHEYNFTATTLDMKGNTITNGGNITLYSSAGDARYLHLPRGGGITLYGDGSAHHGIFSRNSGNSPTDDILISSYGAVYFDLDSNSNNSSSANFEITKHNGTAAIFKVDGETSDITTLGDIYIPSKILHTGDTDTYTQFHAANQWRVVTGGTERLEVNQGTATVAGTLNVRVAIDLADSDFLRLGSGDDVEFFCNGSHMYMDLNSGIGNFYIRDGTTVRYTFNDNGSFTATGNITAYSDRRVKAQFEPITDALSKVQQLHGQTYIRTDMDDANRRYAGLIAQDVEAVLPEAVSEVEDHLTLDYSGTIGLLVEAIKELKQEVNDLRAQLEDK